jgi:hypothetical protein
LEITELGLERTVCFGRCPDYTIIFAKDGTVRYHGGRFAQRTNDWTGTIGKERFDETARFIADSGYAEFEAKYFRAVTDNPTVFTMVAANGRRKVISNYAQAGPEKLKQVEKRLTELLAVVKWDEQPAQKEPVK